MVAKSYQNLEIVGDVYTLSGRQYVNVKTKSGTTKSVRWYTSNEYAKMYSAEKPAAAGTPDPFSKSQKEALGFTHGYITIFKGDTYSAIEWFRKSLARYARWWGWYIISTYDVPNTLPTGIEAVRLPWELVGLDNGVLKPEAAIKEAVDSILYADTTSEYVGSIGERLELFLTVDKVIDLEGNYGSSSMFIMHDDDGNCFTWTTSAKNWSVGSEHHIKGTVKEFRKFRNQCQTVLSRCLEQKTV